MDEASIYFDKFISNQLLNYPEKGQFDYVKFAKVMEQIQPFDHPDFYSVDGNTIYIYEHFEIDASKHTKKGTDSRIDIGCDNRKFQEKVNGNNGVIYHGQLTTKLSFEYYLENLYKNYENHYKKIEAYKDDVCKKLNINKSEYSFKVIFMIEDTTVFGTCYFEKGMKPVLPIFTNQFLDFIANKTDVDNVICSIEGSQNQIITWMYSRDDEAYFRSHAINLLEKKIINFEPMTMGTSIFIPFK